MTVESASFINGLNATLPTGSDQKAEGDDHIRLLKTVVKATFPNVTGAVTASHTELNTLVGASGTVVTTAASQTLTNKTVSGPSVTTTSDSTAGIVAKLSTTAGLTGLTIQDQAGARKAELLFLGSANGGVYGATAGNSVLNFASGNFTMSFGDTAKNFFLSTGNVGLGTSPASKLHLASSGSANTTVTNISGLTGALRIDGSLSNTAEDGIVYQSGGGGGAAITLSRGTGFDTTLSFYTNPNSNAVAGGMTKVMSISSLGDITALGVAISRSKSATTSRNSTTTATDDPDLVVPLTAGRWSIDAFLPYFATTGGAGGIKLILAFSGTQTNNVLGAQGRNSSGALGATGQALGSDMGQSAIDTSIDWLRVTGTITVTVSGNLSLQWAQNSSNANAANINAGAWLSCVKVG